MRIFRRAYFIMAVGIVIASAGVVVDAPTASAQTAATRTTRFRPADQGDTKVGTGATAKAGQTCVMHYTGWLYQNGAKGKKFDSSLDRGQPSEFPLGTGTEVIAGLG